LLVQVIVGKNKRYRYQLWFDSCSKEKNTVLLLRTKSSC